MSNRKWLALLLVLVYSVSVLAFIPLHSTKIFAVTNDGEGLAADLELRIEPGTGKIFSGVDSLVGTSTQNAFKVALDVAQNYVPNAKTAYNYYFDIQSTASIVDGPSAGAATTLLVVSMLRDQRVPDNVALTGTVSADGSVGTVGGVFEKAKAAHDVGIKLFLIPRGESRQVTRTPQGIRSVNLVEYAPQEWGMKVVEVDNLDQVLELAFSDIGSIDVNQQIEESRLVFIPEPIPFHPQVEPLRGITEKYLQKARERLDQAKTELNTTVLTDKELVQIMFESLTESENVLEDAQNLYDQNFLYSAANFAFTAMVNAMLVRDIAKNPSILNENSTVFQSKLSALQSELDQLKNRLDGGILSDQVDWQVAAQQRWLWAQYTVDKLRQTQTIVIQTDSTVPGINPSQVDRLRDLEFAVAWEDVAEDFSVPLQNATQQISAPEPFRDFANELLIDAENLVSSALPQDRDDIERRFEGAKRAQSLNWFVAQATDASSVSALIIADQETAGKDLASLETVLDQKIVELDALLSDDHPFVWARIYLDHARYFQQALRFYKQQNRTTQALAAAQSGVSVAFLAQSAFESHEQTYSIIESTPSSPFAPKPFNPISSSDNSTLVTWALAVLVALLLVGILLFLVSQSNKQKTLSTTTQTQNQFASFLEQNRKLDAEWQAGGISKTEYLQKRAAIASQIQNQWRFSSTDSAARLTELGDHMQELEKELRTLRKNMSRGQLSETEFASRVESVQKKLQTNRLELEKEKQRVNQSVPVVAPSQLPAVTTDSVPVVIAEPKSIKQSQALDDIARQVKKNSSTKKKKRK